MKRCPTCKRTFDDNLTYCLIDGSILSPPFEEEESDVDSRVTEVLPEGPRAIPPTERGAPQSTIAAPFEPIPRVPTNELIPAESKPVGLIGLIGLVTILYSIGIIILLASNWEAVSPRFGWILVRRIPIFILVFVGIVMAFIRLKQHIRASLLVILALIVEVMEGLFFYLLSFAATSLVIKMHVSSSASEWLYFFMYFFEDFIFAAVIILLVSAAFTGRDRFARMTTETS